MVMGRSKPYREIGTGTAICGRCGIQRRAQHGQVSNYCIDCVYPAQLDGWTPRRGTV